MNKKFFSYIMPTFILVLLLQLIVYPIYSNAALYNGEEMLKIQEERNKKEEKKSLIVSYKRDFEIQKISGINPKQVEIEKLKHLNKKVITLKTQQDVKTVIQQLQKNKYIKKIELNKKRKIFDFSPNDPYYAQQWALKAIKIPQVWNRITTKGRPVVIAVIDTGLDLNHEDLKGQIAKGGYNFILNSDNIYDLNGHGTAVSGVIAAKTNNAIGIAGVSGMNNIQILPLQVGYFDGTIYTDDVVRAINYAIERKVDVINLSFGSYEFSSMENEAIQKAIQKGIVVVAAAGNEGTNRYMYPASYKGVISVGSSNQLDQISSFSNVNDLVDIYAPGEDIVSLDIDNGYSLWSGTSFSTPFVSALCGIIKSMNASLQPKQIEQWLKKSSSLKRDKNRNTQYYFLNSEKTIQPSIFQTPEILKINPISDQDAQVVGYSNNIGAEIRVMCKGKLIGRNYVQPNHTFTVKIPKQQAGSQLNIFIINSLGLTGKSITTSVKDMSPPPLYKISIIKNSCTIIKGMTEANATIYIKKEGTIVKKSRADQHGIFSITLTRQPIGTSLGILLTDACGNKSKIYVLKISKS